MSRLVSCKRKYDINLLISSQNTDQAAFLNCVSLNLLYKQDRLSYLPIPEIWRLLLSFCIQKFVSLPFKNTSEELVPDWAEVQCIP